MIEPYLSLINDTVSEETLKITQLAQQHLGYRGPNQPYKRQTSKIGRNDMCPCGSGKKYKHCCIK